MHQLMLKFRISCLCHCFVSFALVDSLHAGSLFTITESSFSSNSCCPVSSVNFYSGLSSSTSLNRDSTIWLQKLCDYSEGGPSRLFFLPLPFTAEDFHTPVTCAKTLTFPWANQNMHKEAQRIFFLLQMFKWHSHIGVFYSRKQKRAPEKVVYFSYSEML